MSASHASQLTDNQLAEFKDTFKLFDKDGDGTIASKDIATIIRALNAAPTEAQLKEMMKDVDPTGHGTADFQDVLECMIRFLPDGHDEEEEILNAFKTFDKDSNGLISAAEIRHALVNLEEKLTDEEVDALIREADPDGDGYIKYGEFAKILAND
ncbi:neo-calmodulin-like [Ylistrum balloti]|uniref:neo-calmodulin-like n=1 Tax=Ylistrum balloti TaxID=509963 RepID=UPI002905F4B3|nr:neo-calmodulin-like [Ylistrum balloti]